jgi:hypothetical protein
MNITPEMVMKEKPCPTWTRRRVLRRFNRRESVTLTDIWGSNLTYVDKCWLICRFLEPEDRTKLHRRVLKVTHQTWNDGGLGTDVGYYISRGGKLSEDLRAMMSEMVAKADV